MASDVSISNMAFGAMGHGPITAFTDNSVAGRLANLEFADRRDELLRLHTWRFAVKRTSIAANATGPDWGFTNAFDIPIDSLLILEVNGEAISEESSWRIEGTQIVTSLSAPLEVRYVAQITDANAMDSAFRGTLVAFLAMHWCERITGSEIIRKRLESEYTLKIAEARSMNSIEATPSLMIVDTWDKARR